MTPTQRATWIDAARGISITLVVAGHNPGLGTHWPEGGEVLQAFRMPLFFAIVGTTLAWRPDVRTTALRVAGLLISYLTLCLLSLPMAIKRPEYESLAQTLLGIAYGTGHTILITPLWFLPCLAMALLVVHGLDAAVARFKAQATRLTEAASAAVACAVGLMLLEVQGDVDPVLQFDWGAIAQSGALLNLDLAWFGAGFIILGRLLKAVIQDNLRFEPFYAWVALGLGAAFVLLYTAFDSRLDLNLRLAEPGIAAVAVATMGCAAAMLTIFLLRHTWVAQNVAAPLGRSTLLILWLHAGLEKRVWNLMPDAVPAPLGVAMSIAAGVAIPFVLDRLLMYAPALRVWIYPQPWLARFKAAKPALAPSAAA